MGTFWQIKIETYRRKIGDRELVDTRWFDRFENLRTASTFIREYCKLNPEWKLLENWNCGIEAVRYNDDGSWDLMVAYEQILYKNWEDYITSNYRECKAKFDTADICYNGSNI